MTICEHSYGPDLILHISSDSKLTGGGRGVFPVDLAVVITIHDLPLLSGERLPERGDIQPHQVETSGGSLELAMRVCR